MPRAQKIQSHRGTSSGKASEISQLCRTDQDTQKQHEARRLSGASVRRPVSEARCWKRDPQNYLALLRSGLRGPRHCGWRMGFRSNCAAHLGWGSSCAAVSSNFAGALWQRWSLWWEAESLPLSENLTKFSNEFDWSTRFAHSSSFFYGRFDFILDIEHVHRCSLETEVKSI